MAQDGDPAGLREDRRKAPTLSDLLDEYLKNHVKVRNKPSTQAKVTDYVKRIIRPALGRQKVGEVARSDIARFHSGLSETPTTANRVLAALSKAFSLAELWGYRPENSNPCTRIERFKEASHKRFLSATEFATLGEAMCRAETGPLIFKDKKEFN